VARCRSPDLNLLQHQDTRRHAVKSQPCAPEDGQKIARNMLSWSWRSINRYCCIYLDFLYYLPTSMMHGQTQIKLT